MTSTLRIARTPKTPAVPLDPDALDRLNHQAKILECSLEGLIAMGACFEIMPADLTPLVFHVMEMQETLARLRAARDRR